MNKCCYCGKIGNDGFRDGEGKWVCGTCGIKKSFLHYDYYDIELDKMLPPVLPEREDLYFNDFMYQMASGSVQIKPVNFIMARNIKEKNNYTWLEMIRALEYFYVIKRNPFKKNNTIVGIIPFIMKDSNEYYKIISQHHYKRYSAQAKALKTQKEVKEVEVSHPKKQVKQFSLEEL